MVVLLLLLLMIMVRLVVSLAGRWLEACINHKHGSVLSTTLDLVPLILGRSTIACGFYHSTK